MASTYTLKSHSYDGRYMKLTCTQTKNVPENTSTVEWELEVLGGDDSFYTTGPTTVVIDGTTVYYKAKTSYSTGKFPAAKGSVSGKTTVKHDSNGDATIELSIKTNIYTGVLKTSKGKWTLNHIDRFATIESAPNFNDEENPTITYSNPAGSIVTSLQACIASGDGSTVYVPYRDISKSGKQYTFELTDAERNTLRAATTNANSMSVRFYVRSTIGSNTDWDAITKTLSIKNPMPTLEPDIRDSNAKTVALTGDSTILVKYHSNAAVTIGAKAVKKATIVKQSVTCGSITAETDTVFDAVSTNRFVFSVVDSRGNTTTDVRTSKIVDYVPITCTLTDSIPDAAGNMLVQARGKCFGGNFGARQNSVKVFYRYKTYAGEYCDWVPMTVSVEGNTYDAQASISGLDYQTTYVFQAYTEDELESKESSERAVISTPVFAWGKDFFKFNVPVTFCPMTWLGFDPNTWQSTDTFQADLEAVFAEMPIGTCRQVQFIDTKLNTQKHTGMIWKYAPDYGFLTATNYSSVKAIKNFYNNVWQPWEWENPPMNAGVEYRTTDRINGKVVYKKLTSDGEFMYRLDGETTWHRYVDVNPVKLLWEGSWSSGTLTVPNTSKYYGFRIAMSGQGTVILGFRYGSHVRGVGGYTQENGEATIYQFTATISGDTWTFVACNSFKHNASGDHGSNTARTVVEIRGLF